MKKIVSKNDKMCLGEIGHENLSIPHPPLIDGQKFAGFWSARIPAGGTNCEGKKYHLQAKKYPDNKMKKSSRRQKF